MKKAISALMLAAILFYAGSILSAVQDFSRSDGNTWREYHDYVKLGFALGFLVGTHKAIEELSPFIRQSSYTEKRVDDLLPVYNITNTELKERLDGFYSSPENLTVPIKDAAVIVCKELVPVKDVKLIEREKEIAKLQPAEQRVERIKDTLKEDIKKGVYPDYEVKEVGEEEKVVKKETKEEVPLETKEEVEELMFDAIVPGEARVKEVVKVNYGLAIGVGAAALVIIGVLVFILYRIMKKR